MNLSSLLSKDLILLDFRAKEHTEALQGRDVESIFEEVKMKDSSKSSIALSLRQLASTRRCI